MADERYCADCKTLLEPGENECPKCGCSQKIGYIQIKNVIGLVESSIDVKLIKYSKQAIKTIGRMDAATKQRIKAGILGIPQGDIKPLQGHSDGRQRLRIGKYRVIFQLDGDELSIIEIGSRGDIYK